MVIAELVYKKPIEDVDQYLSEHRAFLQKHYEDGTFLASGPQNPRIGGILIALKDKEAVSEIIKQDPFYINDIADYKLIEFDPVKFRDEIKGLV